MNRRAFLLAAAAVPFVPGTPAVLPGDGSVSALEFLLQNRGNYAARFPVGEPSVDFRYWFGADADMGAEP